MPKFLVETKYTLEGIKGVKAGGGSARAAVARAAVEELGGSLEAFYFAFGTSDVYFIADLPDNTSAAALGIVVSAGGGATTQTTVLITPEEMDAAAKVQSSYKPPGG
jgi:uncharacterized protein with GYD domain